MECSKIYLNLLFLIFIWSCRSSGPVQTVTKTIEINDKLPVISFALDTIHIGSIIEGKKVTLVYPFTNTGNDTLLIDLVTACKCTDLRYSSEAIPPGEGGEIEVDFDSTGFKGEITKTIDIISNTEPIVKEAWFTATVVQSSK